jgi:UDP-glucuronate decarboxylase
MTPSGVRVLVTGGAGFIGSHLCDRLLSVGATVVCLDNLETGFASNLADAMLSPRFTFVEGDVRQGLPCGRFDQIYNLACPASPPQHQRDPIGTMKTNVLGAIAILDRAAADGARAASIDERDLWRPRCPSAAGGLCGPRQLRRAARLLR